MMDLKCVFSAISFLTSNILFVITGILLYHDQSKTHDDLNNDYNDDASEFELWKGLDPNYLSFIWKTRRYDVRIMWTLAALSSCVAWFSLCGPILQVAWVLSKGGKRLIGLHSMVASLAIAGSFSELMTQLLSVGAFNASLWIATSFNLDHWEEEGDGTGWRVLEMIHIAINGLTLWIDAFEAIALSGILFLIHYSVMTEGIPANNNNNNNNDKETLPRKLAHYGLFLGTLSLVDFLSHVLRFVDWRMFHMISTILNVTIGCVLLPFWILVLGRILPGLTRRCEVELGVLQREAAPLLSSNGDGNVVGGDNIDNLIFM